MSDRARQVSAAVAFVLAVVLLVLRAQGNSLIVGALGFVCLIAWVCLMAAKPGPNDPPKRRWRDSRPGG